MPLARLFWTTGVPGERDAADAERVRNLLARILEEGGPADWNRVRWHAVRALWAGLPIGEGTRRFWEWGWEEEERMAEQRATVLSAEQRRILRGVAGVLAGRGFELAGGTALAAGYLGHRLSEDLGLFTDRPGLGDALQAMRKALDAAGIRCEVETAHPTFARLWAGESRVKVELAQDSPYHLEAGQHRIEGMPLRSLKDLAADKTLALFGRAAARDFVDVYALLHTHYDFSQLMDLAKRKDPGFGSSRCGRARCGC